MLDVRRSCGSGTGGYVNGTKYVSACGVFYESEVHEFRPPNSKHSPSLCLVLKCASKYATVASIIHASAMRSVAVGQLCGEREREGIWSRSGPRLANHAARLTHWD